MRHTLLDDSNVFLCRDHLDGVLRVVEFVKVKFAMSSEVGIFRLAQCVAHRPILTHVISSDANIRPKSL